jgi:hypothetical protein
MVSWLASRSMATLNMSVRLHTHLVALTSSLALGMGPYGSGTCARFSTAVNSLGLASSVSRQTTIHQGKPNASRVTMTP